MIYTQEVENMCPVAQGVHHGAAPVPTEGKWVQNKKVEDISGFTHGVGWCAPQHIQQLWQQRFYQDLQLWKLLTLTLSVMQLTQL